MGGIALCPGTVYITVYCDSVAVDGPYSTALNTNDSTDVIEYTASLNAVQALCQLAVSVSNDYINKAISESFSKLYYNYIIMLCNNSNILHSRLLTSAGGW